MVGVASAGRTANLLVGGGVKFLEAIANDMGDSLATVSEKICVRQMLPVIREGVPVIHL